MEDTSSVTFENREWYTSRGDRGAAMLLMSLPWTGGSLEDLWSTLADELRTQLPGLRIGEPTYITVGGEDALRGVVEVPESDAYGWLVLADHRGYAYVFLPLVIPSDDWSDYEDTFNIMLNSIEFLD